MWAGGRDAGGSWAEGETHGQAAVGKHKAAMEKHKAAQRVSWRAAYLRVFGTVGTIVVGNRRKRGPDPGDAIIVQTDVVGAERAPAVPGDQHLGGVAVEAPHEQVDRGLGVIERGRDIEVRVRPAAVLLHFAVGVHVARFRGTPEPAALVASCRGVRCSRGVRSPAGEERQGLKVNTPGLKTSKSAPCRPNLNLSAGRRRLHPAPIYGHVHSARSSQNGENRARKCRTTHMNALPCAIAQPLLVESVSTGESELPLYSTMMGKRLPGAPGCASRWRNAQERERARGLLGEHTSPTHNTPTWREMKKKQGLT